MAQTAGGTYYAASSELVSSWPATSLDLANQLESRFAAKKVIQVVHASYSTEVTNNTSTYADTGLAATITPSSTANKIVIFVNQSNVHKKTNDTSVGLRLLRGATEIVVFSTFGAGTGTTTGNVDGSVGTVWLDSPATTSAVTYKTQFKSVSNNASAQCQLGNATSTILLLEVLP